MKAFPKFLRSHFDLWTVFLAILYYSLLVGGPFFFLQTFILQHCCSLILPDKKGRTHWPPGHRKELLQIRRNTHYTGGCSQEAQPAVSAVPPTPLGS